MWCSGLWHWPLEVEGVRESDMVCGFAVSFLCHPSLAPSASKGPKKVIGSGCNQCSFRFMVERKGRDITVIFCIASPAKLTFLGEVFV